jgi:hypothetical protein
MSIHVTPIPRLVDPSKLTPTGTIAMWTGAIADIPSGWTLCDGTDSTPDLRERFIQGAANGVEAGATGGSATATPGNHTNHTVTQPSTHAALATHQHLTNASITPGGGLQITSPNSLWGLGGSATTSRVNVDSTGTDTASRQLALTQGITGGTPDAHSGTDVNAHSAHSTADSRPPFYIVLYIMKT